MKQLILLVTFFASVMCNAQKVSTWDKINTQRFGKETIYKTEKNKPLNGAYKIASEKGSYSEIQFKEGKINGIRKDYNTLGILKSTRPFLNGKPHGEWKYYDENEEVKIIENYQEGAKDGKWWEKKKINNNYYISIEYYENDIPTGTWSKKWESGALKEESVYQGKGSYVKKEFHANGELYRQKAYENFKLNGIQLLYSKSRVLLKKELYKMDVLEKKETFFENGRPYEIYNFKNGNLHGTFINYKRSGAKSSEGAYENGDRSGVFKKYMENNGWLYFETTYKNNTENGLHKTYYRSQIVEQEGNYLNGSKIGLWKHYNRAGELEKEIEYDRGTEIERKVYNK